MVEIIDGGWVASFYEIGLQCNYLRQWEYVIVVACLYVCLFVGLLTTLRKNFVTDLHEIFAEAWQLDNEQDTKFWWRSASQIHGSWSGYGSVFGSVPRHWEDLPWRRCALSHCF